MKVLKFKGYEHNRHFEYTDDINRIIRIAASRGYSLSFNDAMRAWEEYSNRFAAGWLILDKDDEAIWDHIIAFLEEE